MSVRSGLALAAIVLAGGALRWHHLGWGLPLFHYPDEAIFFQLADRIAIGATRKMWELFIYPHWHIYDTLGCGARLVGLGAGADMARRVLFGRHLTVLFSLGTIVLTYLVATRLYSRRVGLLAAAFTAVLPIEVAGAHVLNVDGPLTFWVLLSFLCAAHAATGGAAWLRLLGAFVAGLAAATKYPGIFALAPILWLSLRDGARALAAGGWRGLGRPAMLALAAGAACAAGIVVGCPRCVAHPLEWRLAIQMLEFQHSWIGGAISLPKGDAAWPYLRWVYQLVAALPFGLGWPLYLLSLAGAAVALWRAESAAFLVLSFVVPYLWFMGAGRSVFVRYYLPVMPLLVVLAARLADAAFARRGWRQVVALSGVAAVGLYTAAFAFVQADRFSFADRLEAARWLEARRGELLGDGARPAAAEVVVAMPSLAVGYDGLRSVLAGTKGMRIVQFHFTSDALERSGADFVVLSGYYEIRTLRAEPDSPASVALRRLEAGSLGYRLAKEVTVRYFSEPLYTRLDPLFAVSEGAMGYRIFERTRSAVP